MPTTTTEPATRWAIMCGYAGGVLLAVVPLLVEVVAGDFFLLLPVALVLAFISIRTLRGSTAHRVFVFVLALALLTELAEQFFAANPAPVWMDAPPPILFTLAGIALLFAARGAGPARRQSRRSLAS